MGKGDTEEITIEVDEKRAEWLRTTAREYDISTNGAAAKLLRYGLIHHEEAIDR